MNEILKREISILKKELKNVDVKTVIIFISSVILFTLSWYFSNPDFFNDKFDFHNSFQFEIGSLISFSYWFLLDTILFFIFPIVIIGLFLKENISSYGLNFRNKNIGLLTVLFSIVAFLPIIFLVSNSVTFSEYFPLMNSAKDDLLIFIIYEALFILFIFSWEFIFRGFLLFGLEKKFGIYAILIQMIPFVILHNGKPFIETFASIFGAIFLGYFALRTRSIFYGFLIHAIILVTLDLIAFSKV